MKTKYLELREKVDFLEALKDFLGGINLDVLVRIINNEIKEIRQEMQLIKLEDDLSYYKKRLQLVRDSKYNNFDRWKNKVSQLEIIVSGIEIKLEELWKENKTDKQ
jgi:hypothetical protein